MLTYKDFCKETTFCKGLETDSVMEYIFNFLSRDANIDKMINSIKKDRPALEPVLADIDAIFFSSGYAQELTDFKKQSIGRMAYFILAPLGYVFVGEKPLAPSAGTQNFKSAALYCNF